MEQGNAPVAHGAMLDALAGRLTQCEQGLRDLRVAADAWSREVDSQRAANAEAQEALRNSAQAHLKALKDEVDAQHVTMSQVKDSL